MNLVAKEYCACSIEDGVIILSEFAGAADQFRQDALLVNPYDVEGVADAILQAFHMPLVERQRALAPTGTYVLVGGSSKRLFQTMILGPLRSKKGGRQYKTFIQQSKLANLRFVKALVEASKVRPVIERCYLLEGLPAALRHLEAGQARGKAVIAIALEDD